MLAAALFIASQSYVRKEHAVGVLVPIEGIAGYRAPIEAAGYALDRIDVCDPCFSAIDLSTPDLLVMMGGLHLNLSQPVMRKPSWRT